MHEVLGRRVQIEVRGDLKTSVAASRAKGPQHGGHSHAVVHTVAIGGVSTDVRLRAEIGVLMFSMYASLAQKVQVGPFAGKSCATAKPTLEDG